MKVVAEKVKGSELVAGDLFSTLGAEYWDAALDKGSLGERVYIRTNSACPPTEANEEIFRLRVAP